MTRPRLRVAVLGATGAVGQKLVQRLESHPWFELCAVIASERSAGRRYDEAVHWIEPVPLPARASTLVVGPPWPPPECDLALSALDTTTAREFEPRYAAIGIPVISNASAFRMHPRVPLIVPEVNPDHVHLLESQMFGDGWIATNPNCVTVGLVAALKPLDDCFGVECVEVTTLQAVSGAGYPGIPSLEILGNVIPFIQGEEVKVATEPLKILGRLEEGRIRPSEMRISCQATRVPVFDGHVLSISVGLRARVTPERVREAFEAAPNPVAQYKLPSAPERFWRVLEGPADPQPRLHAGEGGGMTVSIGRIRPCTVLDVRLVALVHNTVRGAAGAALLNAELLVAKGLLRARVKEWEGERVGG